jgi:7-cyano-7-deazaguanine reductase
MLKESPLGKSTVYIETYTPDLLCPIPRSLARDKIGLGSSLPFDGVDLWTGFEISWLNPKGKPEIALGDFVFPCTSQAVVESKSFKLYLNSLNQTVFSSLAEVQEIVQRDLSLAVQAPVQVTLYAPTHSPWDRFEPVPGLLLDHLDIQTDVYEVDPSLLKTGLQQTEEILCSNLLKSNCMATGQPDWGSVSIHYAGPQIDPASLLKYIISFRRHVGFGEHCVEQIFHDILTHCKPQKLTVYARYTRRGGLDINPFRSNFQAPPPNRRELRQ